MPSAKLARLQDESVAIATEIETLRSMTAADENEAKGIEERLSAAEKRADDIANQAGRERALDAKLEALKGVRSSDSDARKGETAEEAPQQSVDIRSGVRAFSSKKAAALVGGYLRQLYTGEVRAMGETSTTYDAKGAEYVIGELFGAIVNRLQYSSVALQLATVVTPSGAKISFPKVGDATASFVSEGTASTDQDLATSVADLTLYEMRASVAVSRSLLED